MSTLINKKVLSRRNLILMICVSVFVVIALSLAIPLYILYKRDIEDVPVSDHINVLFIVVDDLRPSLGCYGDEKSITPNIDQLASQSILFSNAYAQQALCGPSRTSFLTSRRPDSLHLYSNTGTYWRQKIWNFTTIPQHFKNHGYETISIGKIFHPGRVSGKTDDYPYSWSEKPYHPVTEKYKMQKVCPTAGAPAMNLICPVDVFTQPEHTLPDLQSTDIAVKYLNRKSLEPNDKFFLAVGLHKPHIPFKFPREYLDLYPIEDMDLAPKNKKPDGLPPVAWNPWMDLRGREDVQKLNLTPPYEPLPDYFQKQIRQNYYASTSYMDDQVGKVLQALQDNGFASNTAVLFIGDHGWSLGEHGEWSKYSNFDVSVKVPMIIYIPGITQKENTKFSFNHIPVLSNSSSKSVNVKPAYTANEFVELVDLFPTLSEIVNIEIPLVCSLHSNQTSFCSEGVSMYPIIRNYLWPSIDFAWKSAVFSQYPRPSYEPTADSDQPALENITIMGYTLKNRDYRYTRWVKFDNTRFVPSWGQLEAHELYDVVNDPYEMNNLVNNSKYSQTIIQLFCELKEGWRNALPPSIFNSLPNKRDYYFTARQLLMDNNCLQFAGKDLSFVHNS